MIKKLYVLCAMLMASGCLVAMNYSGDSYSRVTRESVQQQVPVPVVPPQTPVHSPLIPSLQTPVKKTQYKAELGQAKALIRDLQDPTREADLLVQIELIDALKQSANNKLICLRKFVEKNKLGEDPNDSDAGEPLFTGSAYDTPKKDQHQTTAEGETTPTNTTVKSLVRPYHVLIGMAALAGVGILYKVFRKKVKIKKTTQTLEQADEQAGVPAAVDGVNVPQDAQ